ncbi:MAG TPA: hypothetical protein VFV86_10680 [Nitrososphaeraceae archaeon]|nr:hypothetical protein [Nitrososphaeraceae archaeon]
MATTIFDSSIFKEYFDSDDPEVLAWAENVLAKVTEKNGIVPNYISRENDFEETFNPSIIFFAYLVIFSRVFESFKEEVKLAFEYLVQNGQYPCDEESLTRLRDSITNLLRVRAYRGGLQTITPSTDPNLADGEILRLICWNSLIFFKLGVAQSKYNSWNINNSSPLYRGCTGRYDLNIAYEYTEDVIDLSAYPLINSQYCSLSTYRGNQCIEIESVPFGEISGIGAIEVNKKKVIDPRINFEITFWVAQDITFENITFGCLAFDAAGDQVNLLDCVTGNARKLFFSTRRLNQSGKFYQVRGIIYNKDKELLSEDDAKLNIGFGRNLKFADNVVSIIPYIICDNNFADESDDMESDTFDSDSFDIDSGDTGYSESESWSDSPYDNQASVFIWNLKITPCNTAYNRCYINNKNFIDVFLDNQNGAYSDLQINSIFRKYFIPYNTAFKITHLGEFSEIAPDVDALLLENGDYILLENEDRILLEQQSNG